MFFRLLLVVLGMWLACLSEAQAAPADQKRSELQLLHEQIRSLQQDIARGEENRDEVADDLADAERSISGTQRRLREIARAKREAEAEVGRLKAEELRAQGDIAAQRKQLGETLYRVYVEGGQAGARRLLSGDNPNQLARDAYYLEQIAKQRSSAIDEARIALQNLQQVLAQAEARRTQLASLETERIREQKLLLDTRQKHRAVLAKVADKLRVQRHEMLTLQRDQARLGKLLKGLEQIAKEKARQEKARLQAALRRKPQVAEVPKGTANKGPDNNSVTARSHVEPIIGRADEVVEADSVAGAFASLKGRLHWPAKGELTGRFGTPRADGGALWRGVFIRAGAGGEVRSVAGGKVAFADWLRGFGNLIIIDHGDGYMTIYGNNESLYKTAGQAVKAGEAIATIGTTGGLDDSGLYFEIRYRGEPTDPVKWVSAR